MYFGKWGLSFFFPFLLVSGLDPKEEGGEWDCWGDVFGRRKIFLAHGRKFGGDKQIGRSDRYVLTLW